MNAGRDPLSRFERNEACWCGSDRKYKACHGSGARWPPGAPVPSDRDDGSIFVAPDVLLPREELEHLTNQMTGAPIYAPSEQPRQRPYRVSAFSEQLARVEPRTPSVALRDLGRQRFAALEELGLADPSRLSPRLGELSEDDYDALVHLVFDLARATLNRLLEQGRRDERPTTLWSERADGGSLVGRTLLWADHYLVPDGVAEALLDSPGSSDAPKLEHALSHLLALRSLVELGVVVPVPDEVLTLLTADDSYEATEKDLNGPLAGWVIGELEIEGPTAREVLFVNARDDLRHDAMYFYGRIDSQPKPGTFTSTSLGEYDPEHDYSPWITHTRRQTAAKLIQEVNRNLAFAQALGAQFVTHSVFEGRLLQRKGRPAAAPAPLLHAEVPVLPEASPDVLARLAEEDEAVAALRSVVRRSFREVRPNDESASSTAAERLVEELADAARRLEERIRHDRRWRIGGPAILGAGAIALGAATGGPLGAAAGVLGTLAGLSGSVADRAAYRQDPGFALVLARRAGRG